MNYSPGPMTLADWQACKFLKLQTERDLRHNWGEISQIDRSVIRTLDTFASTYNHIVLVTCGTQGQHIDGSYHYPTSDRLGIALDFMMPNVSRRGLPDILFQLLKYPFGGVGIYSDWALQKGRPCIGGFHVDMRPTSVKATWLKGSDSAYTNMSLANLRKYFV